MEVEVLEAQAHQTGHRRTCRRQVLGEEVLIAEHQMMTGPFGMNDPVTVDHEAHRYADESTFERD
jgi:hypothetical protein